QALPSIAESLTLVRMSKERRQALGNGDRRSAKPGNPAAWRGFEPTGTAEPSSDIWAAGLLRWWDTAPGPTSAEAQKLFRQVVELGRPYFSIAERLAGNPPDQNTASSLERWFDELRGEYSAFAERATAQAEQGVREMLAFWESSLDQWRRAASVRAESVVQQGQTSLDPFGLPAIGYTREWQERYQR